MGDKRSGWSKAEKADLIRLLRMALILLLAIAVAGTIAALLSSSASLS
ncbi:MAG: hypothetical protein OXN94_02760 [Chloroflexota bacterium]|nr:hypothetical protein [Chloroflexota bacterium]MDE2856748.1 hypothetical protein [Chloroflexota bacterium]MDE2952043.1 hypothetical protein [Chloroflexota bacterium]